MDADTILTLRSRLGKFLGRFDDCFATRPTRALFEHYVAGQLSSLPRKSVEPIALQAGVAPRTLQQLMSLAVWDEDRLRDDLQRHVARSHPHDDAVVVVDETSFVKKGRRTACVQRQHCGAAGKVENCVVTVHLGYATPSFRTLVDGDLYLPEATWHEDRDRCREAWIPDEVVYRPKWVIAIEQIRRAKANGLRFAWTTCDEGYGGKPPFLAELDRMGQNYVAEIPVSFRVWTHEPRVVRRDHATHRGPGRPRSLPRLAKQTLPQCEVRLLLPYSSVLRAAPWTRFRTSDGEKGPMAWEVKRIPVWLADEHGLPTREHQLLVARRLPDGEQTKWFLSNAPASTPTEKLLLVAFSRWKIERTFEDAKTELGLADFEMRKWKCLRRHLIASCVSHAFLSTIRMEEEKRGRAA
jgi:SRSO17 transposase